MRGKDFNTGLRGGLFEAQHYARMGAAIWLYGWLVLRQTRQQGQMGWVLGGSPVSYHEIEEETGFNVRTLERWMRDLRRAGYIETESAPSGVVVRITKAKKFPRFPQAPRKSSGGIRRHAESSAQPCVADRREVFLEQQVADRIGSSSLERSIEKQIQSEIHNDFHRGKQNSNFRTKQNHKASFLGQEQNPRTQSKPLTERDQESLLNAWIRRELLRAEREEETRRELAVGTGPEVIRP